MTGRIIHGDATDEHFQPRSILQEAAELVDGDRANAYGPPADNHGCTAEMFGAYLRRRYGLAVPFDAQDVCVFNIVQKLSREAYAPSRDSLIDIAGYAENLDRIRA